MPTVKIKLRTDSPALDVDGDAIIDGWGKVQLVRADHDEIDLDRLSPRARALAEAIADSPLSTANEIWVESDEPIRARIPDWETWYSPERAEQGERRPWSAWDKYRATDPTDPHDWLERQAAKIPAGWHVLGATPHRRVPTADTALTAEQVLDTLKRHGRFIKASTWRSYVARGQAPAPVRRMGSTPLWDPADIEAFARSGD
jgi:hypothetical protein